MKKTLSIHLGRQLFTIEEDAYERLQDYLAKLKQSLSGESGVEDILEDIEMRCAELLQAKISEQNLIVVRISEVEQIIESLGEPEVISENTTSEGEKQSYTQEEKSGQRRLFRDAQNGTIGGVCTGLATYLNIDPVVIKILFVIAMFMGFGFFLYLILWIVVPNVKTPSDRLQLKGKPVTVETLKEEIGKSAERVKEDAINASNKFKNNEHIAERTRFAIGIISKLMAIGFLISAFMWLVGFTLLVTGILAVFPVSGAQEYTTFHEYLSLVVPPNRALDLVWNSILITGYTAPLIGIVVGIRLLMRKKSKVFTYSIILLPIIMACGILMGVIGTVQTVRDFAVDAKIENQHIVIDAPYMNIEQPIEYVGDRKLVNSDGIDFIHIENGRITESGVYFKTRPSNDTLFHVYQYVTADGTDRKSAIKRSGKIRHSLEVVGNTIRIDPNYSYPLADGVRGQEVEIVIEVPLGKSLKIKHQPIAELNKEHNGYVDDDGEIELFKEKD